MPGERLVWSGQPKQGIMLTSRDALLVPFSLLWGGFALFWNVSVWKMDADWFFRLWGLPFLVAGLYLIFGRFLHDAWVRSRTDYAVTNKRAIIMRGPNVRSLDLDRLPLVDMSESANGSGTLRFGEPMSLLGRPGVGLWSPALDPTPQFVGIPDVRAVYGLVTRPLG